MPFINTASGRLPIGVLGVLLLVSLAWTTGCSEPPAPPEIQPPVVDVETVLEKDVQLYGVFTGTVEAYEMVDVVARVRGTLQEMSFEPSGVVEDGQKLFLIEPDVYAAQLQVANARLELDEARKKLAEANLGRAKPLYESGTIPAEEYQTRVAERDAALAQIESDKGNIKLAEHDMDYTTVHAETGGVISRNLVDVGNLVEAGTKLATIRAMQPIYVYFDMSDTYLQRMLVRGDVREMEDPKTPNRDYPVFCEYLEENSPVTEQGVIDYFDNTVNREQGVVQVRGRFENKDVKLYPGMSVRVRVPAPKLEKAMVVRADAVGADLQGRFLMVVEKDGEGKSIVRRKSIEPGPMVGAGYRVVKPVEIEQVKTDAEGTTAEDAALLKPGDQYIVGNMQRARLGGVVKVTPRESTYKPFEDVAENVTQSPADENPPREDDPVGAPVDASDATAVSGNDESTPDTMPYAPTDSEPVSPAPYGNDGPPHAGAP